MISIYFEGNSWAHRMNARLKLGILFILSTATIVFDGMLFPLFLLAISLGAYTSLGPRGVQAMKAAGPLLPVLAIIIVFHWVLGSLGLGVTVAIRMLSMVLLANFISITTNMDAMMLAVEPLFYPLRALGLSSRKMSLAVALVIRFVPVLLSVYSSLQEAYWARTGKRNSWRLIAPFLLHALAMATKVAEAIYARGGVDGYRHRLKG
ncbi:energy-coupling factor transporter transmembrane component T family protein [Polycladidibacter stylochi]|uniref:energy-coupling factor transporter transmembrane component T family protein n=1 Tax=Polycladidibacter stylochi TaxID=1807766 RepID=UPI00082DF0D5|nr:energy-coupling factor transporter transmembrane protein EcfT [Pseudovibrio stylochi]